MTPSLPASCSPSIWAQIAEGNTFSLIFLPSARSIVYSLRLGLYFYLPMEPEQRDQLENARILRCGCDVMIPLCRTRLNKPNPDG